jgi:hypothetical protein
MQKNDHRADRVGLLGWSIDGVPLVLRVMRPRLDYYIACVDLIGFTQHYCRAQKPAIWSSFA